METEEQIRRLIAEVVGHDDVVLDPLAALELEQLLAEELGLDVDIPPGTPVGEVLALARRG